MTFLIGFRMNNCLALKTITWTTVFVIKVQKSIYLLWVSILFLSSQAGKQLKYIYILNGTENLLSNSVYWYFVF